MDKMRRAKDPAPTADREMPTMLRFGLRGLLFLVAAVATVLGLGRWVYLNWDEYHVATFSCGAGRAIVITADSAWEISQPVHYRVITDGKAARPKRTFYFAIPGETPQFSLVSTENGAIAGVVRVEPDSRDVLIVHDFATGDSWPALFNGESDDADRSRLQGAFERLHAENDGLRLKVFD